MINNRQPGRRRGRGSNNSGPRQGGQGRGDSANRIDSRARGNANQLYEKYKNLASDAQRQGDRVNIEYYLQFADHYFRVLNDQRLRQEENQPRRHHQRDDNDDDNYDASDSDDFADEGDAIRPGEQNQDGRSDDARNRGHDARRGNTQSRDDRPRREPRHNRDDQRYDDDRDARGDRPRSDARDTPRQSDARQTSGNGVDADVAEQAEQPKRRVRTRREPKPEGSEAAALDADRLPPALSVSAGTDTAPEKPRRRRVRTASTDEAQAS